MRLFIAIEIPINVQLLLRGLTKNLENSFGIVGKWVDPANLHITVAFLGDVSLDKISVINGALKKITRDQNSFDVAIEKLLLIPLNTPRVLALGVRSAGLCDLQKKAVVALKQSHIFADVKPPHLTLVRLKEPILARPQIDFRTLNFKVGQFILFESTLIKKGPIYRPLRVFKLVSEVTVPLLRPNLAICVLNPKNEVLLIRRADHSLQAWQFPQGGIKAGDSLEQTLVKEIKEELGITQFETILLKKQVHQYLWSKSLREKGTDLEKKPYFGQEQSLAIIRVPEDRPQLKPDPHEAAGVKWVLHNKLIQSLQPARRKLGKLVVLELQRINILPTETGK